MHNPATSERAEPSAGATAAAGRRPRAVSADSFRLLTAKLKGAPGPASQPVRHDTAAQPDPIPAARVESAPPETENLAPYASEESPPAVPTAGPAVDEVPPAAPLPDFAPLSLHMPDAAVAVPEFPARAWQDDPLPLIESLFGPSITDETPAEQAESQPQPAPFEEPPFRVTSGLVEELIAAPAETPETEPEPAPIIHAVEPQPVGQEEEPGAEFAAAEAEAELPQDSISGPPPVPPTAVADEPEAQPLARAEEQDTPEAKTRASEMAGRVVDAMIKTISTAIYAKPSAAERAAFLREMAVFMAEAANESDAAAAGVATTAAPAGSPPASSAAAAEVPAIEPPAVEAAPASPAMVQDVPPAARPAPLAEDPFTEPPPRAQDPRPLETPEAHEESGELALTLLDMMSGGSSSLPHERTLAADTLLRILPRIPVKQLIAVVERVAIMETPPAQLVARLIRDARPEIVGPLLERCSQISDQDLMNAAPDHDTAKLRMIARRRTLSTVLSDYLIATGEPGVLLTLIRNPAAAISHDAFFRLAEFASRHHGLLAPLATRADLPPPVAFELFWHVPQELRRFIFSRFLTDSETLNKILRITLATHASDASEEQAETKFPSREALDEALNSVSAFKLDAAAVRLAELARISRDTAMRILSDREGEPLTVLLKVLGCGRARLEEVLRMLRGAEDGLLRPDRKPEELQAIFDSLSFNKARILLTYWDWYVRKSGPYAPQN